METQAQRSLRCGAKNPYDELPERRLMPRLRLKVKNWPISYAGFWKEGDDWWQWESRNHSYNIIAYKLTGETND